VAIVTKDFEIGSPIKVAMVAAMPYPSGQGTQALVGEMARGLTRNGHSIRLVCYHHGAFEREEPFPVHRVRRIPFYRRIRSGPDAVKPFLDLLLAKRTVDVVRQHGCRLIHAHNYEGALAGWIAARACRVPLVYHSHNLMEDELPRYFESRPLIPLAAFAGKSLDRFVPRLADVVIALHEKMGEALRERGVLPERIRVVEPGIDKELWYDDSSRTDTKPIVVYTGNLDNYQDLPILFRAIQEVVTRHNQARLIIATPNDPHEAWRLAVRHGAGTMVDIEVTHDAHSTRKVLQRARVAASPRSSWSGFPVKNLNAAAAGVPVVACQGSAFGVEHNRSGLVVPDHDARSFAGALLDLIRNPEKAASLGEQGRRLVAERYSLGRMLDQIEQVWASVVRRN
jgi:glycosyltransferase involved in cell wall biosynthesis